MNGKIKRFFIFGAIVMPIFFVFVICSFSGVINTSYSGFALDHNGLLYVGKYGKIDVYDNGEFVKTFSDRPGGYYRFTIKDEHLYIVTPDRELEMDLAGNIVERRDLSDTREFRRISSQRNAVITDDAMYIARGILGYYKITKYNNNGESEMVFKSPVFDIILQLVAIIGFVSFFAIFAVIRVPWWVKKKENQRRREK